MPDTFNVSSVQMEAVLAKFYKGVYKTKLKKPVGLFSKLPVDPFATRKGTEVVISRYADLPDNDEPITNEYTRPDFRALKTGQKGASIVTLMDNVAITEMSELTAMDGAEAIPNLLVDQARRSVERYLAKNITAWSRMIRADLDPNYQYTGLTTTIGGADGSTMISTGVAGKGDDYWTGALVTLIDEEGKIFDSRYVEDDTSATGTLIFTLNPWTYQIQSGTRFHICHFTGITATDKLSIDNLREANILMGGSGHMGDGWEIGGGGYAFIVDAFNFGDLMSDTNLVNLFIHKEKESGLRDFEMNGKIMDLWPVKTLRPFRCAVGGAGTYARTGICDISLVLGMDSASRMPLGKKDIELILKPKTDGGHYNPGELYSTATWKHKLAAVDWDPSGRIGIICGQSRQN